MDQQAHQRGGWSGTAMFIAAGLAPTYTVAFAGFNFPGYAALYAVIVNSC
jgi:SSS family solute:Na+ symporter